MNEHLQEEVLDQLDDQWIECCLSFEQKSIVRRKRRHRRFVAIAACFALLVTALLPLLGTKEDKLAYQNENVRLSRLGVYKYLMIPPATFVQNMWLPISPKTVITVNDAPYHTYKKQAYLSDDTLIGEKLGEVSVTVFLREQISANEFADKDHSVITASVYEVEGMSATAGIALQFLDDAGGKVSTKGYVLLMGPTPPTDSLTAFLAASGLSAYGGILPTVVIIEPELDGKNSVELRLTEKGISRFLSTLLTLDGKGSTVTADNSGALIGSFRRCFDFSLSMSIWYREDTIGCLLLDNGKLLLTWQGSVLLFDIGTEAAEELIDGIETDSERPKKKSDKGGIAQGGVGVGVTESSP